MKARYFIGMAIVGPMPLIYCSVFGISDMPLCVAGLLIFSIGGGLLGISYPFLNRKRKDGR